MEMSTLRILLEDPSAVGSARRQAVELAGRIGLSENDTGCLSLLVTEAASNVVKHGGGGEILLAAAGNGASPAVDILALDNGNGILDLAEALRDGFSSAGTPGSGLGAIGRLGSTFDLYSRRDGGTALYAQVRSEAAPPAEGMMISGINVPYPGETVSGDCWAIGRGISGTAILIADGLGHGEHAHAAARAAEAAFQARIDPPAARVANIHHALRATRGAAVAVAEIDRAHGVVRFAGLGNIAGTIIINGTTRSVVSHHGTAGHDARRVQEFTYPWTDRATLVLHSDGLMTRWSLDGYPGLIEKHPMLIGGVLYRDFRRGRDDATVVVARSAA
jgi:anti-sigma regulatory factor (Ser/Thr protein kinase)